jgi:hypothetical protein
VIGQKEVTTLVLPTTQCENAAKAFTLKVTDIIDETLEKLQNYSRNMQL